MTCSPDCLGIFGYHVSCQVLGNCVSRSTSFPPTEHSHAPRALACCLRVEVLLIGTDGICLTQRDPFFFSTDYKDLLNGLLQMIYVVRVDVSGNADVGSLSYF